MHIEFKTYAMQASTWVCTNQMQTINVHELAPPTCVLLIFKNFYLSFSSMLLPLGPCPYNFPSFVAFNFSLMIIYLSQLNHDHIFVSTFLSWSYLCSNFSPFVNNFHKGCVIPIKSLHTNWKSVNLIVTKDCIGIDGWGLNLAFLMDITICVGMTFLVLLLRYHIGSLTLIPFGGALPLCHSMGHTLVNLDGEGTCFAWWSLKVKDHLWNHLLVWYIPYV